MIDRKNKMGKTTGGTRFVAALLAVLMMFSIVDTALPPVALAEEDNPPMVAETPEVAEEPETPEEPEEPEASAAVEVSEDAEAPEATAAPETAEMPETADAAKVYDQLRTADAYRRIEADEPTPTQAPTPEEEPKPEYRVTVAWDRSAGLPANAELSASEVKPERLDGTENKAFSETLELVLRKLNLEEKPLVRATILDVSLTDPETGKSVQPAEPVQMTVELLERKLDSNIWPNVVYLKDIGAEEPAAVWTPMTLERAEGEEKDRISFAADRLSYVVILEYEIIPTAPVEEDPAEETPAEETLAVEIPNTDTLTAANETVQVSASFDESAGLPEGAELGVTELTGEAYDAALEQTAGALDLNTEDIVYAKIFEVNITDPESGESVQPEAPVEMNVLLADAGISAPENAQVIRLDEEVTVLETITVEGQGEENYSVAFNDEKVATYAIVETTLEKTLTASDGNVYDITVTYGKDAGIPDDAELSVREILEEEPEYAEYIAQSAEALGRAPEDLVFARPFDISLVNPETGEEYQPTGEVKVSIRLLDTELDESQKIDVVHIRDEAETMDTTLNGENVEFTTEGFSVYVIVYTTLRQTLTASDGNEYLVTVTYDNTSGIPSGAELYVSEIKEGEAGYEQYVAQSAAALGEKPENLAFARPFDITLKNPETGEEYQPNKNVAVTIELLKDDLNSYASVDVIHIPDEAGREAEVMDSTVHGESVEFETDGFSVYVLTGVKTWTYRFWVPKVGVNLGETETDEYYIVEDWGSKYDQVAVNTESGMTNSQVIKGGEKPVVPQLTNQDGLEFAGWFEGTYDNTTVKFEKAAYNFDGIPESFTDEKTINLYARYSQFYTVTFHGQYDDSHGDYPVAFTRRGEVKNGSAVINISDLSAVYNDGSGMGFYGWSEVPIQIAGEGKDNKITEDSITVDGNKQLYPIFLPIHWLYYYSAKSGEGATYVPTAHYFEDEGEDSLEVPEWAGHTFQGWYTGVLDITDNGDGTTTEVVTYSVKVTDADGIIENVNIPGVLQRLNGKLFLEADTTLYAKWSSEVNVDYKIIIWRQKTTDALGLSDSEKNYDFYESVIKTVPVGSTAVIDDDYKNYATSKPITFDGYSCRFDDPVTPVNEKGYTILNVWYDREGAYTPTEDKHSLRFIDSADVSVDSLPVEYKDAQAIAYGTSLLTGNNGGTYVPADPSKPHYTFTGWYADKNCTTQVFFSQDELNAYTGYNKTVLYDTMPDYALTIYAGWEAEWYLVQIDPNYGTFNGSGGTWFWETIDGDLVREYTQITRDYVPSSSGEFYYVKHDRQYYGYEGNIYYDNEASERNAFYDADPGKATEDTTFVYMPGIFSYVGWYEVLANGTEVPYDFSKHVDHDLTLKLHWKRSGDYYISYNPVVTSGNEMLTGTLVGTNPEDSFADNSSITVSCSAVPPSGGYIFAGWKIRGDDSGRVYGSGQTFTLSAEYAELISGKETVYLDAVYTKVGMAKIIYNANGGVIASSVDNVDFGSPADPYDIQKLVASDRKTATAADLVNNSKFTLSDGTGFSYTKDGVSFELIGWCQNPVFRSGTDTLFALGETYGVDREEPLTLYAVWDIPVTYRLNNANADWGGTWDSGVYTPDDPDNVSVYTQTVNLGNAVTEPPYYPSDSTGKIFAGWTQVGETELYDFSKAVEGALSLQAKWEDPAPVTVHAVDASAEELTDKSSVTGWTVSNIAVGTAEISLPGSYVTAPSDYTLAFVAASESMNSITEQDKVTAIKYSPEKKKVCVKFDGDAEFSELDGRQLYYVYYLERELNIRYKTMLSSGELIDLADGVLSDSAPYTTGDAQGVIKLGTYDMDTQVTQPKGWVSDSFAYYAFAIGKSSATNASHLSLITSASGSDGTLPPLRVENTWRGFRYSEDNGSTWVDCGYAPVLYVVYFTNQPTTVKLYEKTVGSQSLSEVAFTYDLLVTETTTTTTSTQTQFKNGQGEWKDQGDPVLGTPVISTSKIYGPAEEAYGPATVGYHPYTLKNGESETAILFYSTTAQDSIANLDENTRIVTTTTTVKAQSAIITQTAASGFTTTNSATGENHVSDLACTYTTNGSGGTKEVTFTNTHKALPLEIHVAVIENGSISLKDTERSASHTISVPLGEKKTFTTELNPADLYTGSASYSFGAVVYGDDDGSTVNMIRMDIGAVAYEQLDPPGGSIYELVLKDDKAETCAELGKNKVYYLYYPMPVIRYVKENPDGSLEKIMGSEDGSSTVEKITYNRAELTINGWEIKPDQAIQIPMSGFRFSQETGTDHFRMPPILDDGVYIRYLSYAKIGVGNENGALIGNINGLTSVSTNRELSLEIKDNNLLWSFDGENWTAFTGTPTIYAIYSERGYDLEIVKSVPIDVGGDPGFVVTIKSPSIKRTEYNIEGFTSDRISATPASGSTPGKIELTVYNGSRYKIIGLGQGEYSIKETGNTNYILTADSRPISGGAATHLVVQDNSTTSVTLNSEIQVELKNTSRQICKITVNGAEIPFYTLQSAIDYIQSNLSTTETIEMLCDYEMPASDQPVIPLGYSITITTADNYEGYHAGATIKRPAGNTAQPLLSNNGSLTLDNIWLDGNKVTASAPMISSTGTLTLTNVTMEKAISSGNGGAINASSGAINLTGSTFANNSALNGGAIYSTGGSITVSASFFTTNKADTATGGGGAIYYKGMGTVSFSGSCTVSGNEAANGGAVYVEEGTVSVVDGVVVKSNKARGTAASVGYGGAIYVDSGAASIEGGTIGGSGTSDANTAKNGAAVYVGSGSATFSGGQITGNTASTGGAVGVGGSSARLYFSGNICIKDNMKGAEQSNVYLDQDTDTIINAETLSAITDEGVPYIGIHVPGDEDSDLVKHRGLPGATFGIFTTNENLTAFQNDRFDGMTVTTNADTKRMIWGKKLSVRVYYIDSFSSTTGFPRKENNSWKGTSKKNWFDYYLPANENPVSSIAEDLRSTYNLNLTTTAAFACAFADTGVKNIGFEKFITDVNWSTSENKWKYRMCDGTEGEITKLVIYFSEPAYISIENNTIFPLNLEDTMTVLGLSVENKTGQSGYGYVYAVNGAIQSPLRLIQNNSEHNDFLLGAGKTVKFMFPGAVGAAYSLPGGFTVGDDTATNISVKQGSAAATTLSGDDRKAFTLSGTASTTNGDTTSIIFGGNRVICKIVVPNEITGVNSSMYDDIDAVDADGVAYLFSTLDRAVAFAKQYITSSATEPATVEMVTDYMIPGAVTLPTNYNLKFTTAIGDTVNDYNYSTDSVARATISRDTGNATSFIIATNGNTQYNSLIIENLIFDGKNFAGTINGGLVRTKNFDVTIKNADFLNCKATNGGGIYIEFNKDDARGGTLTVIDSVFKNCDSDGKNREGGGAIWTTAKTMKLIGCTFESCTAVDQGGAVFHRIDTTSNLKHKYALDSVSVVTGCSFTNCSTRSGGGIETDALTAIFGVLTEDECSTYGISTKYAEGENSLGGCSFESCRSIKTNKGNGSGGAISTYIYEKKSYVSLGPDYPSYLYVRGCSFARCTTATNNNGHSGFGGAIRSHTVDTEITDSTFVGCEADQGGGAIAVNNGSQTSVIISNCSISRGQAKNGGGVYISYDPNNKDTTTLANLNVIIDGCSIFENTATEKGGGVYTDYAITLRNNTSIYNNHLSTITVGNAAGLYINDKTLTVGSTELNEANKIRIANDEDPVYDLSCVYNNTVSGGAPSNVRLWSGNNTASVSVLCDLGGHIGVINPGAISTQFGSAPNAEQGVRPNGLADPTKDQPDYEPTFYADDRSTYGIIDRQENRQKIVWAGPPVCKITYVDENNVHHLLYLDGQKRYPAIFDALDGDGNGNWGSAFSFLRGDTVTLYKADKSEYTGNTFYVELLVGEYELGRTVTTKTIGNDGAGYQEITLTTAGSNDADYPYRGTSGTSCTVIRKNGFNSSMFSAGTKLIFENIVVDGGSEKGLSATANGGILLIVNSRFSEGELGEKAVFQNSSTTMSGGAVSVEWGDFTLNGGTIQNCSASVNGGAVYMKSRRQDNTKVRGYLRLTSGTIQNCTANNGGAIYVETGDFQMHGCTIRACEATNNGGGICYMANGQSPVKNDFPIGDAAIISGCRAGQKGGGIYVNDGKTLNMSDAFIMGNHAGTAGGGIAVGGSSAQLVFSGSPYVSGNTCDASVVSTKTCNIQMDQSFSVSDNNPATIIKANGLSAGARIGIYVPDAQYTAHGDEGDPFGTFTSATETGTLYGFVNDRNGLKGGLATGQNTNTDKKVYWIKIFSLKIEKEIDSFDLTDSDQEFTFHIVLSGQATDGTYAEQITTPTANPTKYGAIQFTGGEATVTLKPGESITGEFLPAGLSYSVTEDLTTEQQKLFVALPHSEQTGMIGENAESTVVDRYLSVRTFTNIRPVCKITDENEQILFYTLNGKKMPAAFTSLIEAMEHIDNADLYSKRNDGSYMIYNDMYQYSLELLTESFAMPAGLTVKNGKRVILTTAHVEDDQFPLQANANAPAIVRRQFANDSMLVVESGGELTVRNITLDGVKNSYTASSDGGIVYVSDGAVLYLTDGATLRNSTTSGDGGAVYAAENAKVYLSGNISFGGSGVYNDGSINPTQGNFSTSAALPGKKNGLKDYTLARQDIYLAGYEAAVADPPDTSAESLVVYGNITSGDGAIWVWAEKLPRYKTFQQFAKYTSDVTNTEATLAAFRNAQDDTLTGADQVGRYLYGITMESDTGKNVFWYGLDGFPVKFKKIDGFGNALENAVFTLYSDSECTTALEVSSTVVAGTSDDTGVVIFDNRIPIGVYYMKETTIPTGYANTNTYIVLVGDKALAKEDLDATATGYLTDISTETITGQTVLYKTAYQDTESDYDKYAVFLIDSTTSKAVTTPDIAKYGIMNISTTKPKTILRKIDDSYTSLEGAVFEIYSYDMTKLNVSSDNLGPSDANGVFFIGNLPYGYYYLHETTCPTGIKTNPSGDGWWYTVRVDEQGTVMLRGGAPSAEPYDPNNP